MNTRGHFKGNRAQTYSTGVLPSVLRAVTCGHRKKEKGKRHLKGRIVS